MRSFLDESGVRYVDLFDVFAEYEPEDLWVSPENAHWNDLATSAAAAEIAPLLLN